MRLGSQMRTFLLIFTLLLGLSHAANSQNAAPDGVWATVNGIDSADLVVRGWNMLGTTGLAAGAETGLLVTFWGDSKGNVMRCIFSLVNSSGNDPFETCSVAATVTEESQ